MEDAYLAQEIYHGLSVLIMNSGTKMSPDPLVLSQEFDE
jgi:hypothetical protein